MAFLFNIKKYLRELQRADDQRKKHWLVSVSMVSMILIIFLWAVFFNLDLKPTNQDKEITAANNQKESFWQTVNNGIKSISSAFNGKISDIRNSINKSLESLKKKAEKTNDFSVNENAINPPISNFTPLPSTPLP
ncbi:MAG: hypothetical protein QMD65_00190 [Patescibacteria group bacterium]|nr:hypothetical protein [Patescibacteria group bacterium]